jgi:hypothetical protein
MSVSLLRAITALLLVSFATLSVPAQQTKPSPDEKPRKIKRELEKAYIEWINDVDLILTQAERDAWTKLDTDAPDRQPQPRTRQVPDSDPYTRSRVRTNDHAGSKLYRGALIEARINCSTWSRYCSPAEPKTTWPAPGTINNLFGSFAAA